MLYRYSISRAADLDPERMHYSLCCRIRIHVRIKIRIQVLELLSYFCKKVEGTSVPWTNRSGSGSGSCFFSSVTFRMPPKNIFCLYFFSLVPVKAHLHHYSKIKKSYRSHKTVEMKVFLPVFAWWWKDPDLEPYLWLTDPDPGDPKTYGSGSGTLVLAQMQINNFSSKRRLRIWYSNPAYISLNFFLCRAWGGVLWPGAGTKDQRSRHFCGNLREAR